VIFDKADATIGALVNPHPLVRPDVANVIDLAAERRRRCLYESPVPDMQGQAAASEESVVPLRVLFAFANWPWRGIDMVGG